MVSLVRWVRARVGRRLALAFTATALSAAALTAIVVNLAFGSRFEGYPTPSSRPGRSRSSRCSPLTTGPMGAGGPSRWTGWPRDC